MSDAIPFHRPSITDAEVDAVTLTLRSGWLTSGPRARELESVVAGYVGMPHAVALSSCTAALHLGLIAAGVGPGDEVITSPYTFVATGETILYLGATPVFVDVERSTKNLNPALVASSITLKTRAVVTVSIAGHPCRAAEIESAAKRHAIPVVEDAAHSLTAQIGGVPVGRQADLTCFSFYATKGVTAGEGGMVVTGRAEWADRVRRLSLHGLSSAAWSRYDAGGWWEYDVTELGYKYNLTDVQAALALAQMTRAEAMRARREAIASRYAAALGGLPGLALPSVASGHRHAWHLYQIEVVEGGAMNRDGLALALREDGIGTSVHFKPLHLFPWYQKRLGVRPGQFPSAESCYAGTLSLPIWPDLTDADVDRIAERIRHHLRG
jgi:dTDP-4-amino-4,6-dideoxygalactose transaminase